MPARSDSKVQILSIIRHPYGGIRSYLRYNYSRLDPARYEVTVVTIDHPEARLLSEGMAPLHIDLQVVPLERPFPRLVRRTRALIREKPFHLIHSQGLTAGLTGVVANTPKRLPHVVTLHETLRAEQFNSPIGVVRRAVLARALMRADRVIAVGQDACDNLRAFLPLRPAFLPRLEVIRNGVAVDDLLRDVATSPSLLSGLAGADPALVLLGFVGRFMPEKGFGVLIDAIRLLADGGSALPKFMVIAVNDGAYIREFRREIREKGLDQYFHFIGLQPSVAGLLVELDALVVPSLREACPLVAMEAQVLGCPLIASDCIGLREVTCGSPALVSAAGDAASLATALRQFMVAPAQWKRAAIAHVEIARREFDSARTIKRLEAVFRDVMSDEPATKPGSNTGSSTC